MQHCGKDHLNLESSWRQEGSKCDTIFLFFFDLFFSTFIFYFVCPYGTVDNSISSKEISVYCRLMLQLLDPLLGSYKTSD